MKYGRNVHKALVTVMQFGIDMFVPIALCSFVGYRIDKRLGTSWVFIVMFFVGAAAGAGNVYRYARGIMNDDSGDVRNRDMAIDMSAEDAQPDDDDGEA